jgi:hypothetical protein
MCYLFFVSDPDLIYFIIKTYGCPIIYIYNTYTYSIPEVYVSSNFCAFMDK